MFKECNTCGKEKKINLFVPKTNFCKECRAIYNKAYREANKNRLAELRVEYSKKYYVENKKRLKPIREAWRKNNKTKIAIKSKQYRMNNREAIAKRDKEYEIKAKDKIAARKKKYRENNKEKLAAQKKIYMRNNRAKINAKTMRYIATKKQATPLWANRKAIDSLYALSSFLTLATFGYGYHVDHTVPLNSKSVCGLHCEDNLQILRAEDNKSKSNRFWPNMWPSLNS